jgi:pre-mRNA-processing factor 19
MQVEGPQSLPKAVKDKIQERATVLFKDRKSRQISPNLATSEDMKSYDVLASHNYHKSSPPGVTCLSIDPHNPHLILTGGNDGNAILFNTTTAKIHTKLLAENASTTHSKPVTSTQIHAHSPLALTASEDASVKLWSISAPGSADLRYSYSHTDAVVAVSFQPTGEYFASIARDGVWGFHDAQEGGLLTAVHADAPARYSSGMFHPDGLLLGVGEESGRACIWDMKSLKIAAKFQPESAGHVTCLDFSENGYYLAVGYQLADHVTSSVSIWDLRKQKAVYQIPLPEQFALRSLAFDFSGNFLAAAGAPGVQLYFGKSFAHIQTLQKHSAPVTGVRWGSDAAALVTCSLDRCVKIWGKK